MTAAPPVHRGVLRATVRIVAAGDPDTRGTDAIGILSSRPGSLHDDGAMLHIPTGEVRLCGGVVGALRPVSAGDEVRVELHVDTGRFAFVVDDVRVGGEWPDLMAWRTRPSRRR